MSKTVKFSLQVGELPKPQEPILGSYLVALVGGAQQTVSLTQLPFEGEFIAVAAGNYSISAQALDVNNNPVGVAVVCAEFNVPVDTQNIGTVESISVAVE